MIVRCRVQTVRDKWKNSRKNLKSEISANDIKAKIYTLKDEIFKEWIFRILGFFELPCRSQN